MARYIALLLVLILAVLVMGQFHESMNFDYIARQLHMNKLNKVICHLGPEYGKCKGHRQLWYYNPFKNKCQKFVYSNCGGNRNHFFSRKECDTFCTEKAKDWSRKTSIRS